MSIKSWGKIAAIAAVAGLSLTACTDGSTQQAREQEETCGLLMSANSKASEAMSTIRATTGPDARAAFSLESVALDLRNHSYDRSNTEQTSEGESVQLRTALQVQAAQFQELSDAIADDVASAQDVAPDSIEAEGMDLAEASGIISGYCGEVFAQQQGGGF